MDHIGRRPTVVVSVALAVMSWAVLYQATRVWEIYVSRVIGGIGGGIIFTTVPTYVGEIAEVSFQCYLKQKLKNNLLFSALKHIFSKLLCTHVFVTTITNI